jgi:hypothetical protein
MSRNRVDPIIKFMSEHTEIQDPDSDLTWMIPPVSPLSFYAKCRVLGTVEEPVM